ncbi:MAG: hypothetical protein ACYCQJ_14750 [Nitrososphaerales archaeon]
MKPLLNVSPIFPEVEVEDDPILKLLEHLIREKLLRIGPDGQDVQYVELHGNAYVFYDS